MRRKLDKMREAGEIAAKIVPADPAVWHGAAIEAGYHLYVTTIHGRRMLCRPVDGANPTFRYLDAWLGATPGGDQALADFLDGHGFNGPPRYIPNDRAA